MKIHLAFRLLSLALALPVLALSTGCVSSQPPLAGEGPLPAVASAQTPEASGVCYVELRPDRGAPSTVELSLSEVAFLNDAAEKSGATDRFSRMEGYIIRETPQGQSTRLGGRWEKAVHRFSFDTDVALHPGDHVVLIEDASSIVGDMLESILKPTGM